jgi:hypothetical protein
VHNVQKPIFYLNRFRRHEVESPQLVVFGDVSFVELNFGGDSEVDKLKSAAHDQEVGRLQVEVDDALLKKTETVKTYKRFFISGFLNKN